MRTKIHSLRVLFYSFVALISAAIAAHGEMSQGTAVVKSVAGSATYLDELGFSHPLTTGTVLKAGHTIKTGVDSYVDLFLDHNGPNVALDANTTLRLEKLAYEQTSLGTKIDTLLDLKSGMMAGQVKKLIAASRYEVKMPNGVAHVRGTTFYINIKQDSKEGDVHVTSGTVNVTITVNAPSNAPGQTVFTKTVTVAAGQSLFIPKDFVDNADFQAQLVAVTTPPGTDLTKFQRFDRAGTFATVSESIDGKKEGGKIKLKPPPTSVVVSP